MLFQNISRRINARRLFNEKFINASFSFLPPRYTLASTSAIRQSRTISFTRTLLFPTSPSTTRWLASVTARLIAVSRAEYYWLDRRLADASGWSRILRPMLDYLSGRRHYRGQGYMAKREMSHKPGFCYRPITLFSISWQLYR